MDFDWIGLAVILGKCVFSLAFVMSIVPILIWAERKGSAYIQDRPGPNRAAVMGFRAGGLVHVLADVVKLITKEDFIPDGAEKKFWGVAPVIPMVVGLITFSVVPWGDSLTIPAALVGGWPEAAIPIKMQVASINGGLLFIMAMGSLSVYGIMLAGWGSNNKFSLLGGLRASAQMVSYELAMGLSVIAMFLVYGTVRLDEIVAQQAGPIWNWGIFAPSGLIVGVLAFVMFWTAVFAECNRLPFDLPEGESELVAGYHLEYSSLRFALFFMAEYAHMVVGSAVTATLFFGGYQVPFLTSETIAAHANLIVMVLGFSGIPVTLFFAWVATRRKTYRFYQSIPKDDPRQKEPMIWVAIWVLSALASGGLGALGLTGWLGATALGPALVVLALQLGMLTFKVLFGCWVFIWVRWTLPRFRYDQLMNLGWRMMLPAAIGNVLLAGVVVIVRTTLFA